MKTINPWTWQNQLGFQQAVDTGSQLFASGQCSMSPGGQPVFAGDMAAQINTAVDNIEVVMREAGYSFEELVRVNVYVTDMGAYFASYGEFKKRLADKAQFSCTLLGVQSLAFPELKIEIETTFARKA